MTVRATLAGAVEFDETGAAKLPVTIEPEVAIAGSDIWSTTNLVTGEWQQASGVTVVELDGKYLITVPESPETLFISVGKPASLVE